MLALALETQKQRNKLNQRAHRQRRQQRVQELEDKLRHYESTQLEATQQMQQAARVVAAENAMLRDVLKTRLGMGEREIEELRRQWIFGNANSSETEATQIPARDNGNITKISLSQHDGQKFENVDLTAYGHTDDRVDARCCGHTSDIADRTPVNAQATESSAFMSCEKAAEILSSIRTQDEYYDVRARLGCTTPNTCMIENTTVMDVMNESI